MKKHSLACLDSRKWLNCSQTKYSWTSLLITSMIFAIYLQMSSSSLYPSLWCLHVCTKVGEKITGRWCLHSREQFPRAHIQYTNLLITSLSVLHFLNVFWHIHPSIFSYFICVVLPAPNNLRLWGSVKNLSCGPSAKLDKVTLIIFGLLSMGFILENKTSHMVA